MSIDRNLAIDLIGRKILIGITYLDDNGATAELKQLHGMVVAVCEEDGICVELAGTRSGEYWHMPPDTSGISVADPGEYQLRSTGEVIENPDYLCNWIIERSVP